MRSLWRSFAVLGGVLLAVGGCGLFGSSEVERRCPPIVLLTDAEQLTKFRDGPGRDITDIEFQTRIANFNGTCGYDDGEFDIEIGVDFVLERGPANKTGKATFSYFVAVPKFYPKPAGKRRFDVTVEFEGARTRAARHDDLTLTVPVPSNVSSQDYQIYIGMQLTPEQLRFNKGQRRR